MNSSPGTPISMNDINAMFVWIPRYSYTLSNTYATGSAGTFDIKFQKVNQRDDGSATYDTSTPSGYFTPSSFCWGNSCDSESTRADAENIELPGFWVGKFENAPEQSSACAASNGTANCNYILETVIKPNLKSWKISTVANFYSSAIAMKSTFSDSYGFYG